MEVKRRRREEKERDRERVESVVIVTEKKPVAHVPRRILLPLAFQLTCAVLLSTHSYAT